MVAFQRFENLTCSNLLPCPLTLVSLLSPRKGSSGDGPREAELEDLHEIEPSP